MVLVVVPAHIHLRSQADYRIGIALAVVAQWNTNQRRLLAGLKTLLQTLPIAVRQLLGE